MTCSSHSSEYIYTYEINDNMKPFLMENLKKIKKIKNKNVRRVICNEGEKLN